MSRIVHKVNRFTSLVIRISLRILALFLFLFLLYEGITRGYRFGYQIFNPDERTSDAVETVTIDEDTDPMALARQLEEDGIIWNRYAFEFTRRFYEYELVPGTYEVEGSMTIKEILEEFSGTGGTGESEESS